MHNPGVTGSILSDRHAIGGEQEVQRDARSLPANLMEGGREADAAR